MSTKIKVPNLEAIGYSIISLYEAVAQELGEENWNGDNIRFDCTKINVAKNIYDAMVATAVEQLIHKASEDTIRTEFAMMWCMSGPKAVDGLSKNEVEIFEGFIYFS